MSIGKNVSRVDQAGLSVVELMVGTAVGLVVIAGAIATYVVIARSGIEIFGSAKLNQELRGAMALMTSDIRRAGSSQGDNLFMEPGKTDITIHDSGSCILFAYDATFRDGTTSGVVDNKDYFGYKLMNGAIYARRTNSDGSDVTNCSGTASDWEKLTDEENILIEPGSLAFSTQGSVCYNSSKNDTFWEVEVAGSTLSACNPATPGYVSPTTNDLLLEKRQIQIRLEGKLKHKEEFSMVLEQSVLLANDRVFKAL